MAREIWDNRRLATAPIIPVVGLVFENIIELARKRVCADAARVALTASNSEFDSPQLDGVMRRTVERDQIRSSLDESVAKARESLRLRDSSLTAGEANRALKCRCAELPGPLSRRRAKTGVLRYQNCSGQLQIIQELCKSMPAHIHSANRIAPLSSLH